MITSRQWAGLIDSLAKKTKAGKIRWVWDATDFTGSTLKTRVGGVSYRLSSPLRGTPPIELALWNIKEGVSIGRVSTHTLPDVGIETMLIPGGLERLYGVASGQAEVAASLFKEALREIDDL